jgi:hypothetical protein
MMMMIIMQMLMLKASSIPSLVMIVLMLAGTKAQVDANSNSSSNKARMATLDTKHQRQIQKFYRKTLEKAGDDEAMGEDEKPTLQFENYLDAFFPNV